MRWKQSIVGEAAAADTSLERPEIDEEEQEEQKEEEYDKKEEKGEEKEVNNRFFLRERVEFFNNRI